jgi:hypothetical protein
MDLFQRLPMDRFLHRPTEHLPPLLTLLLVFQPILLLKRKRIEPQQPLAKEVLLLRQATTLSNNGRFLTVEVVRIVNKTQSGY